MKSLWRKSIRKKWIFKLCFASKCRSRMYLFATCNVNIWHEIQISMCILASFIVINMPLFVALKLAILVLDQRNELILIYRNIWKFEKKIEKILYLLVLSYSVEVTSFLFLKIWPFSFFIFNLYIQLYSIFHRILRNLSPLRLLIIINLSMENTRNVISI